jgi:hypothetical protein
MNRIILIGNLDKSLDVSYTPDGQMVTSFSIAANHIFKDRLGLNTRPSSRLIAQLMEDWLSIVIPTSRRGNMFVLKEV